jgi:hypothetical protein
LPGASDPNRFHEERSELAADIVKLARRLAPRRLDQRDIEVELSEERRGRIVTTGQVINGKRLVIQKRKPFSIHVGEQPANKPLPNNFRTRHDPEKP